MFDSPAAQVFRLSFHLSTLAEISPHKGTLFEVYFPALETKEREEDYEEDIRNRNRGFWGTKMP